MASLSSIGIGSSLPVEEMISGLMAVEKRPIDLLQTQANAIKSKISAFGSLASAMSTMRDAALKLTRSDTWSATAGTSSDASAVSITTTGGAPAGSYAVEVQSLAKAQSIASQRYASADAPMSNGQLQVSLSGQPDVLPLDIPITSSDTLATVRDKINAAGRGVSAVIVNDATGARMVITAIGTGVSNAFSVDGMGDAFTVNPDPDEPGAAKLLQIASNARATINGLPITSASNTLSNVMDGVTVTLNKETGANGVVQLKVTQDEASIKAAVQSFVTAFNGLSTLLSNQVAYDEASKVAGALQGDSTAVALQRQMRNIVGSSNASSGVFGTLSSLGVEVQKNGTLSLNETRFKSALTQPAEVKKAFMQTAANEGDPMGFARQLMKFGDGVLGTDGALTTRTAGLNTTLKSNTKRQDAMTLRLGLMETRLRAQYTALDTRMAGLNTLNSYISNQVAAWNKG